VIVLTRNGMPLVARCLRAVLAQEVPWPFEVIVIDSASTDGTRELVKSLAVEHICIQPHEFNHGQTRNLGAHQAKGRFLVFLVQDAVPVDDTWLERLVTATEHPGVAGSYGRELPWPSDNLLVRLHTQQALAQNQERLYQRLAPGQCWQELTPGKKLMLSTFHNTCSCLNRQLWIEHPYRALSYGEDLDWGARVVQAGYTLVYEPQAVVYHSHDRSSWYTMKRAYADHELVMRLFNYHAFPRPTGLVKSWLANSWKFMRVIYNEGKSPAEKVRLTLRTPMVVGTFHVGSYIGARAAKHQRYGIFWQTIDKLMRKGV
jgi:rhamnosyltransferase